MDKVLVNGLQLGNKNSGVQYYTEYLFNELKKIESSNLDFGLLEKAALSGKKRIHRIFFENFLLYTYFRKRKYTLYHSTNYVLPFLFNSPTVLTIHDLITLDFPKFCQTESVIYFKILLSRSIKKATKIIAVSEKVKQDIIRHFNTPEEKIEVIYHGINPVFRKSIDSGIRDKYSLPVKYILFVGNIEPKKNLERIVQAFHQLKKSNELKHKLVIVGKDGWKSKSVYQTIEKLKIDQEIVFPGYVPLQDLPAIYSMAELFVFPSLYEGFGIPPLEAMACEVPVLISDKGSLPEVTGENCLQVDPCSIYDIKSGMLKLLSDKKLRESSVLKGKEWVQQFTWEETARKTINVYKKVLEDDEKVVR